MNNNSTDYWRRFIDWVPSMKQVMDNGNIGDTYEVMHVTTRRGSSYIKTHYGYTHVAYENRHLLLELASKQWC